MRRASLVLLIAAYAAAFLLLIWPPGNPHRDGRTVKCTEPIWYGFPDAAHHIQHPEDDETCDKKLAWRWLPIAALIFIGTGATVVYVRRVQGYPRSEPLR